MGCLNIVEKCIQKRALIGGTERKFLEEKKTNTKIGLQVEGKYLLYDFEKIKNPISPFFENSNEVTGLNAVADKVIIFEDHKEKIWVFVIELKQGKGDPKKQIYATKQLMEFIFNSINRVFNKNYDIELRGLGYSKNYRPLTKTKKIYDKHNTTSFSGDKLILSNYQVD